MIETLKPCPFCGGEVFLYHKLSTDTWWVDHKDKLCTSISTFPFEIKSELIQSWNTRPIEDVLRKRIAELEAETQWISLKDRLPKDGTGCLVYSAETDAIYFYIKNIDDVLISGFTHWMPLPNPPEVE